MLNSKTPNKSTDSIKKQKLYKTVRNILFEKEDQVENIETMSDSDQPLFTENNLKQQEIEAKMFEDVKIARRKNKVKAKGTKIFILYNILMKYTKFLCDSFKNIVTLF